ncbi:hypothetical protein J8F10_05515 [Gemmata sp. G18]|uniref:Uncharacterized protein n=1 Tax=Gemmata palustris TaxID=2822762 RepID=A0ABS5BM06_9BACT|nr:hypothetical protein [Gemmata palustris]MBP3954742.1 hypothetical protein [Gemmata palustris]
MSDEAEVLTLERRRELFVAVVAAQDEGLSVWDSRELIARRFGVDVEVVRAVENEGLNRKWPPFGKG